MNKHIYFKRKRKDAITSLKGFPVYLKQEALQLQKHGPDNTTGYPCSVLRGVVKRSLGNALYGNVCG